MERVSASYFEQLRHKNMRSTFENKSVENSNTYNNKRNQNRSKIGETVLQKPYEDLNSQRSASSKPRLRTNRSRRRDAFNTQEDWESQQSRTRQSCFDQPVINLSNTRYQQPATPLLKQTSHIFKQKNVDNNSVYKNTVNIPSTDSDRASYKQKRRHSEVFPQIHGSNTGEKIESVKINYLIPPSKFEPLKLTRFETHVSTDEEEIESLHIQHLIPLSQFEPVKFRRFETNESIPNNSYDVNESKYISNVVTPIELKPNNSYVSNKPKSNHSFEQYSDHEPTSKSNPLTYSVTKKYVDKQRTPTPCVSASHKTPKDDYASVGTPYSDNRCSVKGKRLESSKPKAPLNHKAHVSHSNLLSRSASILQFDTRRGRARKRKGERSLYATKDCGCISSSHPFVVNDRLYGEIHSPDNDDPLEQMAREVREGFRYLESKHKELESQLIQRSRSPELVSYKNTPSSDEPHGLSTGSRTHDDSDNHTTKDEHRSHKHDPTDTQFMNNTPFGSNNLGDFSHRKRMHTGHNEECATSSQPLDMSDNCVSVDGDIGQPRSHGNIESKAAHAHERRRLRRNRKAGNVHEILKSITLPDSELSATLESQMHNAGVTEINNIPDLNPEPLHPESGHLFGHMSTSDYMESPNPMTSQQQYMTSSHHVMPLVDGKPSQDRQNTPPQNLKHHLFNETKERDPNTGEPGYPYLSDKFKLLKMFNESQFPFSIKDPLAPLMMARPPCEFQSTSGSSGPLKKIEATKNNSSVPADRRPTEPTLSILRSECANLVNRFSRKITPEKEADSQSVAYSNMKGIEDVIYRSLSPIIETLKPETHTKPETSQEEQQRQPTVAIGIAFETKVSFFVAGLLVFVFLLVAQPLIVELFVFTLKSVFGNWQNRGADYAQTQSQHNDVDAVSCAEGFIYVDGQCTKDPSDGKDGKDDKTRGANLFGIFTDLLNPDFREFYEEDTKEEIQDLAGMLYPDTNAEVVEVKHVVGDTPRGKPERNTKEPGVSKKEKDETSEPVVSFGDYDKAKLQNDDINVDDVNENNESGRNDKEEKIHNRKVKKCGFFSSLLSKNCLQTSN